MKYLVHYECNTGNGIFEAEVDVECDKHPTTTDAQIIYAALRDSVRFHKSGQGSVKVITIKKTLGN